MVGRRLQRRLGRACDVRMAGRDEAAEVYFDLASPFVPPLNGGTFDVVIHCAAAFGGNRLDEAVHNESVNAVGSLRVLELAQAVRCRHLVSINSISIFDHPENQYFGSYGLSRKHGHENLQWGCQQLGIAYTALLASQIYDEYGEARRHQPLLYRIVDAARDGTEIELFGQRSPRRNFLFIDDLAAVVHGVIEKRVFGTYPVVAGESPTLVEVVEAAFRVFGKPARICRMTDRPDTPTIYIPSDSTIYDRVGWHDLTTLEAGLALIRDRMAP